MAGDSASGVSIMQMDEGLDTGEVAMAERVTIGPDTTTGELHDALARLGADLMARSLAALERGTLQFTPQPQAGVSYAHKIGKAETRIDWSKPWRTVHNHIRGLSPFPGAWFELPDGTRIRALRSTRGESQKDKQAAPGTVLDDKLTIACGDGAVRLTQVQRAGKQPMTAEDFLRGSAVPRGDVLASANAGQ
jgi:methionyl-tRNA formyltransferase